MDREDLIELVNKIISVDGTEKEVDQMIAVFEKNVPHPEGMDLIFDIKYDGLSSEEIVDLAISYQTLITPPPSKPDSIPE